MEREHDDGLVHDHGWACRERGRKAEPAPTTRPEQDHDDGLVHGHRWASSQEGAPRH